VSNACFTIDDSEYPDMIEIYNAAEMVFSAEDGKCEIKDHKIRAECNCRYRKNPLKIFRPKYELFLKKYPNFGNGKDYFCFSHPTRKNDTVTIRADGYNAISKWCNGS
ncbi:MAG: hypothetical protein ACW7DS_16770, partial [Paraglaciecola chathamensis]